MKKWGPLFVLSLALAIIIIDTTLLNVSLSTLIRELHTNLQSLQWVISAYSLTLAAFTVTGGRMGDLFGRKRMFCLGAILFAVGSFIASISNNIPTLLLGESIIEGIGAALMMPATASLLVARYRGHDRALAFGIWGGIAAAASAVGPILGGFLTTHFSWRWGFRINVFVVAALLLGSLIIDDTQPRQPKRIDVVGVFLSALGLFLIVFGIIESPTYGWWGPRPVVPVAIGAGLVIVVLFALWERRLEQRGGTPIVSMRLFRNTAFLAGSSITACLMLAQNGVIFSLPVFLQSVLMLDAFHTGIALLPMSVGLLIFSPLGGVLTKHITHKRLVQIGLVISIVALVVLHFSLREGIGIASLVPGLALYGIGLGFVLSQVNNLTLSAVAVSEAGEASGVSNTFRQIGASLGAALIGAVLLNTIVGRLSSSLGTLPPPEQAEVRRVLHDQPTSIAFGTPEIFRKPELARVRAEATTEGNRTALLYGAAFAVLALFVSTKLPARAAHHE
ncbi:MAG TPA: MFS transporter [Thermoanaerobaculia bacterium]|nr:MFS transporter [Thermoanaerobaculia bacterium]